ncbi:MAG: NAD(P)/FAD-dependent oxidoreductase [Candidatus Aminicenantes bacterium]
MNSSYDVIILGAGPAGLFAAFELMDSDLDVLVIDKGKKPLNRDSRIFGVGGAGTFSDGKLNLTYKIGGDPTQLGRTSQDIQNRIERIDHIFTELGVREEYSGTKGPELGALGKKAARYGVEFVAGKQRHIGTDKLPHTMDRLYQRISENKIKFRLGTEVKTIDRKNSQFLLKTSTGTVRSRFLVAAPGRAGAYWLRNQAKRLGIAYEFGPIDVGVRLEFPAEIYEDVQHIMYDVKFRLFTPTYDDMVRTFCANPGGFVAVEEYGDLVLVNGHAAKKAKSKNTNLALLSRVELTDPVEDTTTYGRAIARLSNTIGGGKPLLQRLKDLKEGHRSTWERISHTSLSPTLSQATPGDVSMALPSRIVINVLEGIEKINYLLPGIDSENTLVYAPEIKFYDTKYKVNQNLEASLRNFYVAGDSSGYARGIVYSAVTGMIAAEGIKRSAGDQ